MNFVGQVVHIRGHVALTSRYVYYEIEKMGLRQHGDWIDLNFAKILDDRFPGGEICYDVIDGHFIFRYRGDCYDWTGVVYPETDHLVPWRNFRKYDSLEYSRILRDCVM